MAIYQALDVVPLWVLLPVLMLCFLVAVELGFWLGRYRRRMPRSENEAPSGAMVGATLGLLGFMLAFTFGMAGSRFDNRKRLVLDEANAIGTAFLRARLLPEPQATEIQDLLRKYVNVRLQGATRPEELGRLRTEEGIKNMIVESEQLHRELWSAAEVLAKADPRSVVVSLLVQSLNEVIDLHSVRLTVAVRYRIPVVIWFTLYVLSFLSMLAIGFHGGLTSPRRSVGTLLVAFAFVLVLSLIVDLDRGQEGLLQVGQDPLFDVRSSMDPGPR